MKHFRYILDKSSKKYKCPNCGRRTLVLFIDVETGELLVDRYGRCDREVKCGYFFHPSKDRLTNNLISGVHNKLENPSPVTKRTKRIVP